MNESVKHRVANSIIADYVNNGKLKPGDKLPTVRELKDIYKTSDTTVQHALNILELWGIIRKRHGSGSFISEPDSMPSNPLTRIIGCISSFNNDIVINMYKGIEKVCRKRGFHMILASTQDDYNAEQEQVKRMIDMGCQAIVLYPVPRTKEQLANDYLKTEFKDFPMVLVDNAYPEQGISQVIFDNRQCGYEMTEMLIKEGHNRIVFMRQDSNLFTRSIHDRYKGFIDAISDYNIELRDEDLWVISDSASVYSTPQAEIQKNIREKLISWNQEEDHPTAIIALDDRTAVYATDIAQELGFAVPEQLKVVGFDYLSIARLFKPAFTTTAPDFVRAGTIAAEMAIKRITEDDVLKSSVVINMLPVPIKRRKP